MRLRRWVSLIVGIIIGLLGLLGQCLIIFGGVDRSEFDSDPLLYLFIGVLLVHLAVDDDRRR